MVWYMTRVSSVACYGWGPELNEVGTSGTNPEPTSKCDSRIKNLDLHDHTRIKMAQSKPTCLAEMTGNRNYEAHSLYISSWFRLRSKSVPLCNSFSERQSWTWRPAFSWPFPPFCVHLNCKLSIYNLELEAIPLRTAAFVAPANDGQMQETEVKVRTGQFLEVWCDSPNLPRGYSSDIIVYLQEFILHLEQARLCYVAILSSNLDRAASREG